MRTSAKGLAAAQRLEGLVMQFEDPSTLCQELFAEQWPEFATKWTKSTGENLSGGYARSFRAVHNCVALFWPWVYDKHPSVFEEAVRAAKKAGATE